jgi:hypothetical protein
MDVRALRTVSDPSSCTSLALAMLTDTSIGLADLEDSAPVCPTSSPSCSNPPTDPRYRSCRSSIPRNLSMTSGRCGAYFHARWTRLELPKYPASTPWYCDSPPLAPLNRNRRRGRASWQRSAADVERSPSHQPLVERIACRRACHDPDIACSARLLPPVRICRRSATSQTKKPKR